MSRIHDFHIGAPMRSEPLPASWRWAVLKDVAAQTPNSIVDGPFGSNLKTSDYVESGVPVLQGKNITNDRFTWFDVRFISHPKASELKRSSVRVDDILIVKIGSIGYSAIVDHLSGFEFAIIPANLAKITIDRKIVDLKYLHHWLKSTEAKQYFLSIASKTAQPALSLGKIKSLPVPLPPLPEQRRIAEVLDRVEELRAKRRAAIAHLSNIAQTIFLDLFGDPTLNPKNWNDTLTLSDVAEIASGITKGRILNGQKTREVPYLAVANVQDKHLNLSAVKTILASEDEIKRFKLEANDLLLTEGGDPDKLGRGSLWNNEIADCIHQNHIFRVRIQSNELTPIFLNWIVGSQRGKRYFLSQSKQTTGIASINMSQLRKFPMLMPPLPLQQEFARRIASVEKLKATHRASLAELDALFASLQHRAFRGEL